MRLAAFVVASVLVISAQERDVFVQIQRLLANGMAADARAIAERALKAAPEDAQLWNLFGIIAAQQGKSEEAEKAFERAVQLQPRLVGAWLNLGRLRKSQAGREDSAMTAYQAALRLDGTIAEANHELAVLLMWKGRFKESLAHLDRLPAADESRRSALAIRCADEAALGHAEPARRAAQRLLADPQLEASDVNAILPAIATHDETLALTLIEGLNARGLANAEMLAKAAALYEKREDFAAARRAGEAAFQASPKSAVILLDLSRIAWKQKDLEGALGYVAHARDLEPRNAQIHFLFGLICNEMALPIEAKKALEKALELEPNNPYFNYAMGIVMTQYQDKPAALPYLQRYVAAKPDDPRGHLALANLYSILYKADEAKRELEPVLHSPQFRPAAELLLGRIDRQSGDTAGAIGHFTTLLELDPKSAEAHAELGALYLGQENVAAARRHTEEALKLDDKNYTANRTLLALYRLADDPRTNEQIVKLKSLIEDRDARSKLLQRTIEVRPY